MNDLVCTKVRLCLILHNKCLHGQFKHPHWLLEIILPSLSRKHRNAPKSLLFSDHFPLPGRSNTGPSDINPQTRIHDRKKQASSPTVKFRKQRKQASDCLPSCTISLIFSLYQKNQMNCSKITISCAFQQRISLS